jgi:helicase MOV-10
MHAYMGVA